MTIGENKQSFWRLINYHEIEDRTIQIFFWAIFLVNFSFQLLERNGLLIEPINGLQMDHS